MKKIFTLLVAAIGTIGIASAQSGHFKNDQRVHNLPVVTYSNTYHQAAVEPSCDINSNFRDESRMNFRYTEKAVERDDFHPMNRRETVAIHEKSHDNHFNRDDRGR